jgi:pilus assembly protein Flp/PilA
MGCSVARLPKGCWLPTAAASNVAAAALGADLFPGQREVDHARLDCFFDLRAANRRPPGLARVPVADGGQLPGAINFLTAPVNQVGVRPATAGPNSEDTMKSLAVKVQRFLKSEDGPTAVEYAVMLALIVIVCLTAIQSIGTNANTTFESVATGLANGS